MRFILTLSLPFISILFISNAFAAVPFLHHSKGVCDYLLAAQTVTLGDLIALNIVEPDDDYLTSRRENQNDPNLGTITDHEFRTATLLANRLKTPLALIPQLSGKLNVPAVDGIIFDSSGSPTFNFSLKTFMPDKSTDERMLNEKLRTVLKKARDAVTDRYSALRWTDILCKFMPTSVSSADRDLECRIHAKVFGIDGEPLRPVSVVIDYTLDPHAIFRIHGIVEGNSTQPTAYLTLNDEKGLLVSSLIRQVRNHPVVKEYVFIGQHNMLVISESGFQMTEFSDDLGRR